MQLTAHEEKESLYYDNIYARGYITRGYYPLYNEVIKMIEHPGSCRSVLEIGCGVGDLGKMIIDRGYQYRGFDFSPVAVECSRKLSPKGDFKIGDAYDPVSYLPHDYDTVVALEVLEHLDDLRLIENIPSGVRLIASVPNYDDIAHLRLYQDPQRDIIERFGSLLRVTNIVTLTTQGNTSDRKTIYLFEGERFNQKAEPKITLGDMTTSSPKLSAPTKTIKVGRNDPCPCGSGRKYKKCCLGFR
jgi:2-polyprenyl-3-methyl-5-hydroxy-6-metoxy-1,4-benzoquinol methylase